jgi:hypothetical protein
MSVRCENCDQPKATPEDYEKFKGGEGEHLCWAEYGTKCEAEDWRARALAAEREREMLLEEVLLLQSEVRKQVYVSRVLYDREVVERAQLASDEPAYWPEGKTGRTA